MFAIRNLPNGEKQKMQVYHFGGFKEAGVMHQFDDLCVLSEDEHGNVTIHLLANREDILAPSILYKDVSGNFIRLVDYYEREYYLLKKD